jgi:hypothetical protein
MKRESTLEVGQLLLVNMAYLRFYKQTTKKKSKLMLGDLLRIREINKTDVSAKLIDGNLVSGWIPIGLAQEMASAAEGLE